VPRRNATPQDESELPLPRGKIAVPAKKVVPAKRKKPTPAKKKVTKAAPPPPPVDTDEEIDGLPEEDEFSGREAVMDGVRQDSPRSLELAAQMQARLSNEPLFPYPPELEPELKPYWLQLVNSFTKDHFRVSDIPLMKMYCQCAYDVDRQTIMIKEEGEVVMGARAPIVNPRCKVRESNRMAMMTLATKFRNQPASRVDTTSHRRKGIRASEAANGADAVMQDEDGLLAGGEYEGEDTPRMRH